MDQHSVLVVDDDIMVRDSLCDMLSDWGCHIMSADCGLNALTILNNENCELVFSDVDMPDISGFELLARMHKQHIEAPCVLMSARADKELEIAAKQAGAFAMLHKPVGINVVSNITHQIFSGE